MNKLQLITNDKFRYQQTLNIHEGILLHKIDYKFCMHEPQQIMGHHLNCSHLLLSRALVDQDFIETIIGCGKSCSPSDIFSRNLDYNKPLDSTGQYKCVSGILPIRKGSRTSAGGSTKGLSSSSSQPIFIHLSFIIFCDSRKFKEMIKWLYHDKNYYLKLKKQECVNIKINLLFFKRGH